MRHPFYPRLKSVPAVAGKGVFPALHGAVEELVWAARGGTRAERAVFPLLHPARPFLDESARSELWELFQVPVIALLVEGRGEVIGFECEAQQGFHLREDYSPGLLLGHIVGVPCECGRPGPRLTPETTSVEDKTAAAEAVL